MHVMFERHLARTHLPLKLHHDSLERRQVHPAAQHSAAWCSHDRRDGCGRGGRFPPCGALASTGAPTHAWANWHQTEPRPHGSAWETQHPNTKKPTTSTTTTTAKAHVTLAPPSWLPPPTLTACSWLP